MPVNSALGQPHVESPPRSRDLFPSVSKNRHTRQNGHIALCKVRSPPLPPWNGLQSTSLLEGPLAVTERADVSGCELFDYGLAGELLLHHLACRSESKEGEQQECIEVASDIKPGR